MEATGFRRYGFGERGITIKAHAVAWITEPMTAMITF